MAIVKPITRIADFYPQLQKRVIALAIALQLFVVIVLGLLLNLAGIQTLTLFVYILLPVVALNAFMMIIILRYVLEPLNIISRTIAHVSPETNDVIPPNVNGRYYEKTGLKPVVSLVYDLATNKAGQAESDDEPTSADMIAAVLGTLPCGVIALDAQRNIIFANDKAPVTVDAEGKKSVSLHYQGNDTFDRWMERSEHNAVSDTHMWSRVQTALPESPKRQLCDVVATYHKGGPQGIETVILSVDRTGDYATDEEDMDFIALAAHELRGPITVISGYLEVLSDELHEQLQQDQIELFKRLRVSSSRLSGYISNILNVSRYDRRHMQLHLHEDSIAAVYATIADDLMLRATTQNRLLNVVIPDNLPTIVVDSSSLSEVIANLVDNAIKYSNEGGSVEVVAGQEGDFITLSVTDHGIGVPGSIIGHLFSKFYRSHHSRQNVMGTGLGLYISKAIIESHGGRIGVSSSEGNGSTFKFAIPTYNSVVDKLKSSDNDNSEIMRTSNGWIKNHSMYGG